MFLCEALTPRAEWEIFHPQGFNSAGGVGLGCGQKKEMWTKKASSYKYASKHRQ